MINPHLFLFVLVPIIIFSPVHAQEMVYEPFSYENLERISIIASFEYPDFAEYVAALAVNDEGNYLAAATGWGEAWYWELATGELHILSLETICDCEPNLFFIPGSSTLLYLQGEIWDLETNSLTDMVLPSRRYDYEWTEHGLALDGSKLINLETDEVIIDLFGGEDTIIFDAEISADGQYIAVAAHARGTRFSHFTADIFDREGNLVSVGGGDGLSAILNIEISPNSLFFAHDLDFGNIYIGHIPNSPHYTNETIEPNIDTDIESGSFSFTKDSRAIVAINDEGLWAFNIETETRSLLYEGEFYPYTIHKNIFVIAATEDTVFLFGILPEA